MKGPLIPHIGLAGHLGLRSPDRPLFAHSAQSLDPLDQIDRMAELGFAGILDIGLKLRPAEQQTAIGRRLAERAMRMGGFGNDPLDWNLPLWSRTDREARTIRRQHVEESLVARDRVGGGAAVCVTGLDPDRSIDDQLSAMADNLAAVSGMAEREGLTLLVEAVAEEWIPGLLLQRVEQAAAVVRSANSPSVRLLFDVAHVGMAGDDIWNALDRHWDIVGAVQVADLPGRIDLGAGELDWPRLFRFLAGRDYRGLVEIEHEPMESGAAGEERLVERLRATGRATGESA